MPTWVKSVLAALACTGIMILTYTNPDEDSTTHEQDQIRQKDSTSENIDEQRLTILQRAGNTEKMSDAPIGEPNERYQWPYAHTANGPRVHEFLQEMHREALSHVQASMPLAPP
jgi:hypothetical protein